MIMLMFTFYLFMYKFYFVFIQIVTILATMNHKLAYLQHETRDNGN